MSDPSVTTPRDRGSGEVTREALLRSAHQAFAQYGYRASVRLIAIEAGCDAAMLYRHFVTKAEFFRQVFAGDSPATFFLGDRETAGARIATRVFTEDDRAFDLIRAAVKSCGEPEVGGVVSILVKHLVTRPLADWLEGPEAMGRATGIVWLIAGAYLSAEAFDLGPREREQALNFMAREIQGLVDEPLAVPS